MNFFQKCKVTEIGDIITIVSQDGNIIAASVDDSITPIVSKGFIQKFQQKKLAGNPITECRVKFDADSNKVEVDNHREIMITSIKDEFTKIELDYLIESAFAYALHQTNSQVRAMIVERKNEWFNTYF
jgi:hypothetical protein